MKQKTNKLYYSIGEVSKIAGVKPHVLRYWETQFSILNPRKNRAGNRTYRVRDIKFILTIKKLLYGRGYTIAGALQKLKESRNNPDTLIKQLSIPFSDPGKFDIVLSLRQDLSELKTLVESL